MLVEKLIARYPTIYHMAEAGTWSSIRRYGLMSTSAVLDHFGYQGAARVPFETQHRPNMSRIGESSSIVLRDQIPMPPERLRRALIDGTTIEQWYRLINGKVFFWAEEHRLHRLLKYYGDTEHDVLHVDTERLMSAHKDEIWLSHMNSGNTLPIPHHRDIGLFKRIDAYPAKKSGLPEKEVVEIVVDYAVSDISKFVKRVDRMKGLAKRGVVWEA